eukprot:Colp12_sorted_trinity150504_noHs@18782
MPMPQRADNELSTDAPRRTWGSVRRVAFVLYERLTALDLIGVYDPVLRLSTMAGYDIEWEFCALKPTVMDDRGMIFTATQVNKPLDDFDLLIVPGGFGALDLLEDEKFISWLKTAENCPFKASVCTGSILLGRCEWLRGKRATTHWSMYDILKPYVGEVVAGERWIQADHGILTAGGVSSSLDLGLHIVKQIAGEEVTLRIAKQMEYVPKWLSPWNSVV